MLLRSTLKKTVKSALTRAGLARYSEEQVAELQRAALVASKVAMLGMVADADLRRALALLETSQSQLNQDFFVLSELGWKTGGFFVEFGATNGHTLSNSWMLEKAFGWNGILAEPARVWRDALAASGRTAAIEWDCVWSKTGEVLTFRETDWAELSTVGDYRNSDGHDRSDARTYSVNTISLNDMLARHKAPAMMDYLSIDTEGSELEILEALDFDRYRFRTITCEHNFGSTREGIHELLTAHGYRRKFEDLSQFDDWYVLAE